MTAAEQPGQHAQEATHAETLETIAPAPRPLFRGVIAHALCLAYIVARDKATAATVRVGQLEAAAMIGAGDGGRVEIWRHSPSLGARTLLTDIAGVFAGQAERAVTGDASFAAV